MLRASRSCRERRSSRQFSQADESASPQSETPNSVPEVAVTTTPMTPQSPASNSPMVVRLIRPRGVTSVPPSDRYGTESKGHVSETPLWRQLSLRTTRTAPRDRLATDPEL